jgi:hypothetical protein
MAREDDSTTECGQSASCDALRPVVIILVDCSKVWESAWRLGVEGGMTGGGLAATALGLRRAPG